MSPEATFVCLLVAFVAFVLAAAAVTIHPRVSLLGVGLAAWVLVPLWAALEAL